MLVSESLEGLCHLWKEHSTVFTEKWVKGFVHLHNTDTKFRFLLNLKRLSHHWWPKREVQKFGWIVQLWCWWTAAIWRNFWLQNVAIKSGQLEEIKNWGASQIYCPVWRWEHLPQSSHYYSDNANHYSFHHQLKEIIQQVKTNTFTFERLHGSRQTLRPCSVKYRKRRNWKNWFWPCQICKEGVIVIFM